ncbi:hypothetical protein [Streptomyces sp. NBC_01429]|uniref:hypothetical protein n=1 Tax=Streptomyces sp. NBC_01429 TaxID=2903862 RepID=UPI002E29D03E|nr:hypothetical protein [Streptomyces sp. NBC_01429]
MIEPVTDQRLWGVVALAGSFLVLVVAVLWASSSDPGEEARALLLEAESDAAAGAGAAPGTRADAGPSYSYICHCHRAPVLVTVRAAQLPRLRGWGRL